MKRAAAIAACVIAVCGAPALPALSAPPKHAAATAHPEDDAPEAPACSTCEAIEMLAEGRTAAAKAVFERQAARGDITAEYNLGWMYHHGRGVAVDYAKARDLYFRAASGGENVAMNQMGFLYQNGLGVAQNLTTAFCWYTFAMQSGYTPAAKHLVELEAQGQSTPKYGACEVVNHS